jgi:hypothetical protein
MMATDKQDPLTFTVQSPWKPKRVRIEIEAEGREPVVLELGEGQLVGVVFRVQHPEPVEAALLAGRQPKPGAESVLTLTANFIAKEG